MQLYIIAALIFIFMGAAWWAVRTSIKAQRVNDLEDILSKARKIDEKTNEIEEEIEKKIRDLDSDSADAWWIKLCR